MPQLIDFTALYRDRLATITGEHGAASVHARRYRLLFLATGALGALLLVLTLRGDLPARLLLLPTAIFLLALPLSVRMRGRLERLNRLLAHYTRAIARSSGLHPQSGHTGEDLDVARERHHLYRHDLQILGPDSLFGLLATTRTRLGREALARTLLHPPTDATEIHSRQLALQELAPQTGLREHLALLGERAADEIPSADILAWLAHPPAAIPSSTRPLLLVTTGLALLALLAGIFHLAAWPMVRLNLAAILALQVAFALRVRSHVTPILADAKKLPRQIAVLTEAISLMDNTPVQAPTLQALRAHLADAAPALQRLKRTLALLDQRNNQYFFLPALLLALGTQSAISLDRWRAQYAPDLRRWMSSFAKFESLNALATYAFEHPANTYPEILPPGSPPVFQAMTLTHPLLPSGVPNDIDFGPETRFYLISGSNMAGKSTLLRTLGAATVMALAGAPIPAASARLSAFTLCASISVADSLADGKSKFLAEVERLHAILHATRGSTPDPLVSAQPSTRTAVVSTGSPARDPLNAIRGEAKAERPASPSPETRPVLFLIDEIFSGTNSADRLTAAAAVIRQLVAAGALGALSTHDLALTSLAEPSSGPATSNLRGRNLHMASPDPDNPLAFDYLLKPGINPSTNALAILRLIGIRP